jgi:Domain of unknown function (DUF4349)
MGHIPAWRSFAARPLHLVTALGLLLCVGLAGCSASSNHSSAPTAGKAENLSGVNGQQANGAPANAAAADGAKAADPLGNQYQQQPNTQASVPAQVESTARSIIYTGSITLRVQDVNDAAARVTTIATGSGGSIGADQRSIDASRSQATMTLRVPAERFSDVLDQLHKTIGKEESRSVQSQDVTDQVVDVDARIETARASVDRVRALMSKAQTLSDIVSLESELSRRESDLNSLLTRQGKLANLTALSTITVTLLGPEAKVSTPKHSTGFLAGLASGWRAFTASLVALLTVFGALLPWLVTFGVLGFGLVVILRRTHRPPRPQPLPVPVPVPVTAATAATATEPAAEPGD